jgi:uncharacterized protein YciI
MQYLILGYDGADPEAKQRRYAARSSHLALADIMAKQGKFLAGAAMLNDAGDMVGSIIIGEFESRAELDAWLKVEPYVTGKVWERIEITPCRIGPSFQHILNVNSNSGD